MTAPRFSDEWKAMNEPSVSKGNRFSRWRERIRGMLPFASGVAATLLALILYGFLFPNQQLTNQEVGTAIAPLAPESTANNAVPAAPLPLTSTVVPGLITVEFSAPLFWL
jgi:hypothetical protein